MNNLVIICAILLLVLLFLKVPVYIAVLSASAVYFIGTPGMNLSIFAQKTISGAEGLSLLAIPFFVCAWYIYELYGRHQAHYELL